MKITGKRIRFGTNKKNCDVTLDDNIIDGRRVVLDGHIKSSADGVLVTYSGDFLITYSGDNIKLL